MNDENDWKVERFQCVKMSCITRGYWIQKKRKKNNANFKATRHCFNCNKLENFAHKHPIKSKKANMDKNEKEMVTTKL